MRYAFFAAVALALCGLLAVAYATAPAPFTRAHAIDCVLRYVDISPRDGFVTALEIDAAKERYLTWYERGAAYLVQTTSTIIHDCDFAPRDGKLSRRDMELSNATCIGTPVLLDKLKTYLCDRAAARENSAH